MAGHVTTLLHGKASNINSVKQNTPSQRVKYAKTASFRFFDMHRRWSPAECRCSEYSTSQYYDSLGLSPRVSINRAITVGSRTRLRLPLLQSD